MLRKQMFPWIVFNAPGDDTPGGGNASETDEQFLEKNGFPRNTRVDDMEPAQAAAYWRNESKKHQKDADAFKKLGLTPEQIKKQHDDAEAARLAGLGDHEKALETARKEGETNAAAAARDKYLRPAIEGQVIGLTRGHGESIEDAQARVKDVLEFADVTRFIDANGDLDASKIQTFAQSIGPKDGDGSTPRLDQQFGDVYLRQQTPPPGTPGSVDAYENAAYERLSQKKS